MGKPFNINRDDVNSGVDKGGQGGARGGQGGGGKGGGKGGAQPPNELKVHPYEKMKSKENLRGGGNDYV